MFHKAPLSLFALFLIFTSANAAESPRDYLSAQQLREDYAAFCGFVGDTYAYFEKKATDWRRTCAHYAPQAEAATDRATYIHVLERSLWELYDAHAHLGTNTDASPRLVPSQSDVVAIWQNGKEADRSPASKSGEAENEEADQEGTPHLMEGAREHRA